MKPTRETSTESEYLERSINKLEKFRKETSLEWDLKPKVFIEWIDNYIKTVSPATWRKTKASLVWYMEKVAPAPEILRELLLMGTEKCGTAKKTSATKKKSLSELDIKKITDYLTGSHLKFLRNGGEIKDSISLHTLYFLLATSITGMRPSEWYDAEILNKGSTDKNGNFIDTFTIIVKNGKSTNGRSHGQYRTLRFKNISEEKIFLLLGHYKSVKRHFDIDSFNSYYRSCKDKMTYATRSIWPYRKKYPVLYSGRHQFSADLKKALVSLQDQAAMMGHATDETSTRHYGKKKFGKGNEHGIEADPEESSRVKRVARNYQKPDRGVVSSLDV